MRPRGWEWQCWECGTDAPGGVCLGPHPAFQWNRARSRGHVEGSAMVIVRRVEPVVCSLCLRVLGRSGFASHMKSAHAKDRERARKAVREFMTALDRLEDVA